MTIEIEHLVKQYGNKKIINDLSIFLNTGHIYVIQGSNGSGKTTLLNILSGNDLKYEGKVRVNGQAITNKNNISFSEDNVTYVPQDPIIFNDLTCLDNMLLPFNHKDKKKAEELLNFVGLQNNSDQKASSLSLGEKQRLCIARSLYKDKPILLLDEITSSLDQENAKKIFDLILRISDNHIVVFVTHEELDKEILNNIVLLKMEHGKIEGDSSHPTNETHETQKQKEGLLKENPSALSLLKRNFLNLKRSYLIGLITSVVWLFLIIIFGQLSFSFNPTNMEDITFSNYINSSPGFLVNGDRETLKFEEKSVFALKQDYNNYITNDGNRDIGFRFTGIYAPIEENGFDNNPFLRIVQGDVPREMNQVIISSANYDFLVRLNAPDIFSPSSIIVGKTIVGVYEARTYDNDRVYLNTENQYAVFSYSFFIESIFEYPNNNSVGLYMVASTEKNKEAISKDDVVDQLLLYGSSNGGKEDLRNYVPINVDWKGDPVLRTISAYESFSILMWCSFGLSLFASSLTAIGFYQGNKRFVLFSRLSGQKRKEQTRTITINIALALFLSLLSSIVFSLIFYGVLQLTFSNIILNSNALYFRWTFLPIGLSLAVLTCEIFAYLLIINFVLAPKDITRQLIEMKRK